MDPHTKPQVLAVTGISYLFLLFLFLQPAIAEPPSWPPEKPIPRVETGMHTAPIWRLSIDAQERFLVTASKDKTARVWDLAGGELKLLKTLRVPVGEHPFEGQIFSVAISPDGEEVAVAGYTGKKVPFGKTGNFSIFIFDRASGNLKHTISRLPIDISHLTFSRDGQYLAVSLMGRFGLRVYRSRDWQEVYKDPDYGRGSDCYWVEFGPENVLLTTSWEEKWLNGGEVKRGVLHLYKPSGGSFKPIGESKTIEGGDKPMVARFSPDGSLLAVGFKDSPEDSPKSGPPRVMVFDAKSLADVNRLKPLYPVDTQGLTTGHLARVAWSRNGELLFAGGRFSEGGIHPILCWTEKGQGRLTRLPASFDSIMDIWPLKDGRLVFGAADPAFGILDPEGRRLHINVPDISDFYNKQKQFRVSGDGCVVEFAFGMQETKEAEPTQNNQVARLDIKTRKLTLEPPSDPGGQELRPPDTTGFEDSDWKNTEKPRFRNRRLSIGAEEVSLCLTRVPGGQGFILGTNWHLRFFDENGTRRGRPIELPSSASGVNVSGDGQVAVVALGDGTLRWYRLKDRKEILAFLRHRDGRWVMWSPEGFFTCSPDGGKLMVYYLNQGLEKTPQFVTSDQLFKQFYRRDLVDWHLAPAPKGEVQTALNNGNVQQVLAEGPPPTVEIIGPPEVRHKQGEEFTMRLKITDRGGGIGKITLQVNGITLKTRGEDPFHLPDVPHFSDAEAEESPHTQDRTKPREVEVSAKLPVMWEPGTTNKLTIVAQNTRGIESTASSQIVHSDDPKPKDRTLYGLVVGVSAYSHIKAELENATKDALALSAELKKCSQGLFQKIEIEQLIDHDQEVTLTRIKAAIKKIAAKVKPEDAFFLFLAGHGKLLQGRYYFYPQDLRATDDPVLRQAGLGQEKLREWLPEILAQQRLIILDTCYSDSSLPPEALKNSIDHLARELGQSGCIAILAAAKTKAQDNYKGNGLFTYALLEALKRPDTDRNRDKKIDVKELFQAAEAVVSQVSRDIGIIQEPMSSDLRFVKFDIANVAKN